MHNPEFLSCLQFQGTTFVIVQSISALADQLRFCIQEEFTGQLDLSIQDTPIKPVNLYFQRGYLIWGTGGVHPVRRWCRQLSQFCPNPAIAPFAENEKFTQSWDYDSLAASLSQDKIYSKSIEITVKELVTEIFFDLHQQWSKFFHSSLQMKFNYVHPASMKTSWIGVSLHETWMQALYEWKEWQQSGLEYYSPNQAPLIKNAKELQRQVLPTTYQNLIVMMNGRQTLRDLATKTKKPLLTIAQSCIPYVDQELIELLEIGDSQPALQSGLTALPSSFSSLPSGSKQFRNTAPLIAHVDDRPEEGQLMSQILAQLGYRGIHIQDSIQALSLMLEHKPDLIFLDLVMPIINGYEACAQLRRISKFKDTPIIILTSNDGIIDRVRAKIVGSTDFMSKPIKPEKVQVVLQKFLAPLKL